MKAWNRESRALKLRYRERVSTVNVQFNRQQVQLSHDIEQAKNERSLYIAKIKLLEDVDNNTEKINAITERIRQYSLRKVELDHERKLALLTLDREYADQVDALEAKFSVELDEQGKEVVAV